MGSTSPNVAGRLELRGEGGAAPRQVWPARPQPSPFARGPARGLALSGLLFEPASHGLVAHDTRAPRQRGRDAADWAVGGAGGGRARQSSPPSPLQLLSSPPTSPPPPSPQSATPHQQKQNNGRQRRRHGPVAALRHPHPTPPPHTTPPHPTPSHPQPIPHHQILSNWSSDFQIGSDLHKSNGLPIGRYSAKMHFGK